MFYACSKLTSIYFQGDAPSVGTDAFTRDHSTTAYYLPGTTGWASIFGGIPTAPWILPNLLTLTGSGATNTSVVIKATTNLSTPVWQPLQANQLTSGAFYFTDTNWTLYPARFYRGRTQ